MSTTTATAPEIRYIDPNSVTIDANVRTVELDASDDAFVASIRENGILQPVTGYLEGDTIVITMGQRRTLAARAAGVTLPVLITERYATDGDRLVQQIVENDARKDLTVGERTAAWQQLSLVEKQSVTRIAQRTGANKDQVKAGLTIAKSPMLSELVENSTADLLQLAVIGDFEKYPELAQELLSTAEEEPEQFDHAVSRAKNQVKHTEVIEAAVIEAQASGRVVVTDYPSEPARRLSQLTKLEDFVPEEGVEGDGIVIYVSKSWYEEAAKAVEFVTDPRAYGYSPTDGTRVKGAGLSDEERLERRRVIANNKAWGPATETRRAWLTSFISKKGGFPADVAAFMAVALTRHSYELHNASHHLAHELLGISESHGYGKSALADLVDQNASKAGLVTLALLLGQCEDHIDQNAWRHPGGLHRHYLAQLRTWGYALAPVELLVLGEGDGAPIPPLKSELQDDVDLDEDAD